MSAFSPPLVTVREGSGAWAGRAPSVGRAQVLLAAEKVVPRDRQCREAFDKLKLQHRAALVAEGALRRGELIFPDPAEALAMNRPRFVAICPEARAPMFERQRVMVAQALQIGHDEAGADESRRDFGERGNIAVRECIFANPGTGRRRGREMAAPLNG